MVAPRLKLFADNDLDEIDENNADDMGTVQAGAVGNVRELHIWNNKAGVADVSTAEQLRITTVTETLLESGDEVSNGREVVEQQMLSIKSITKGDSGFTPVGGAISYNLGNLRGDSLQTPENIAGSVGHTSGGNVRPGDYYAVVCGEDDTGLSDKSAESAIVSVLPMVESLDENSDSEVLTDTVTSKLGWKFESTTDFMNGVALKMSSGGTLKVNVRVETDFQGKPSGTLVTANAHKNNVELVDGDLTYIFFENEASISNNTVYWVVVSVVSGIGSLRGSGTGSFDEIQIFDGNWSLSSNLEKLTGLVLSYNKIDWVWDVVPNALMYKVYRTSESGVYGGNSLVGDYVADNELEDLIGEPISGSPPGSGTASKGHFHAYERRITVPTNATPGAISFYQQFRYSYI